MNDPITGHVTVIDCAEHHVHQGESFKVDDVQAVDTTTQKWMITTPDSKAYAHMLFDVLATGELLVLVTEGANRTTGVALTPMNRRRVGTPATAMVTVKRGATGGTTDGATTIKHIRFGVTDKFSGALGELRGRNEYILKPNTTYVIAVTTYAAVNVSLHLDWYEHIDAHWSDRVKE